MLCPEQIIAQAHGIADRQTTRSVNWRDNVMTSVRTQIYCTIFGKAVDLIESRERYERDGRAERARRAAERRKRTAKAKRKKR